MGTALEPVTGYPTTIDEIGQIKVLEIPLELDGDTTPLKRSMLKLRNQINPVNQGKHSKNPVERCKIIQ